MEQPNESEDFDWVSALSSCTLSGVFEKLKLQVAADVKSRKAQLLAQGASYSFGFIPNGDSFVVDTHANQISGRAVKFRVTETCIAVDGPNDELMFEATLTLNDKGQCRLLVKGQEKELWQFRKMALESLLFTNPWKPQATVQR